MNLLTIGLVASGIYLLSKANKSNTWLTLINYNPNPSLFQEQGALYAYPFKLENGKLIEWTKHLDSWLAGILGINEGPPVGSLTNSRFFSEYSLHYKKDKEKEAIKWLWNKNSQLMNSLYFKYIIGYFKRSSQKTRIEIIKILPQLLTEYQEILKSYNVPKLQQLTEKDGEYIGKVLGNIS